MEQALLEKTFRKLGIFLEGGTEISLVDHINLQGWIWIILLLNMNPYTRKDKREMIHHLPLQYLFLQKRILFKTKFLLMMKLVNATGD